MSKTVFLALDCEPTNGHILILQERSIRVLGRDRFDDMTAITGNQTMKVLCGAGMADASEMQEVVGATRKHHSKQQSFANG